MTSYRDRLFCRDKDCANFETCDRAYTDEVATDAFRWWGGEDAPVAFSDFSSVCFVGSEE